jgi:hypothetical protein
MKNRIEFKNFRVHSIGVLNPRQSEYIADLAAEDVGSQFETLKALRTKNCLLPPYVVVFGIS